MLLTGAPSSAATGEKTLRRFFDGRSTLFLDQFPSHTVQEQMAHLGQIQVAMNRPPATDLEVVEAQFVLLLAKTLFNGPARIGDVEKPFQRIAGRGIGDEELNSTAQSGLKRAMVMER